MEQLISQLAGQFGIDEALAHKAVGMVLSLLQNQGDMNVDRRLPNRED